MQDDAEIARRKRRSSRCVIAGIALMGMALLVTVMDVLPPVVPTVAALVGFGFMLYGVHVGWLVFYERDPDGQWHDGLLMDLLSDDLR